jgi:hypothetical protein
VEGKTCDIFVEPQYSSGDPVFDITDNSREIIIGLWGTTSGSGSGGEVIVNVDNCASHVESYIAGGAFILNGVTYYGADDLGSGGCFAGKYQIDESDGGNTESFHAGAYTSTVTIPSGMDFLNFNVWDNIRNNVVMVLNGALASGGNLNICDDYYGDYYGIAVTGTVGDYTGTNTLNINLHGSVEISGLTAYNADIYADSESSIGFGGG